VAAFIVTGLLPKPVEVETGRVARGGSPVSVLEEGKTRIRQPLCRSPAVAGYMRRVPVRAGDADRGGANAARGHPGLAVELSGSPRQGAGRSGGPLRRSLTDAAQRAGGKVPTAELDLARKELVRAEQLKRKGADRPQGI